MNFGEAIEGWSACGIWWGKMVSSLVINSAGAVKVIEGGENIISDGLCWVSVKFLVSGGIS